MSGEGEDPGNTEGAAPGEGQEGGSRRAIHIYLLGLLLAVGLTGASFWIAGSNVVWGPAIPAALLALAVAQIGVHLVFFLHITSGPENTNNAIALMFGTFVVVLVIGGSLWIVGHLNHNMAPMAQTMAMQR